MSHGNRLKVSDSSGWRVWPTLMRLQELWQDASAPTHQRCLAARALGLLGERQPKMIGEMDDRSPLARAWRRGCSDFERCQIARLRFRNRTEAAEKMRQFGATSVLDVLRTLQDKAAEPEYRQAAASVLRALKCRDAVEPLIEVLAEGRRNLANACMWALVDIGSRRGSRTLMSIVRGNYSLPARQEAIYTLWQLHEVRAEALFIRVSAALDTEEEYTRDIATEALGNAWRRRQSQKALSERLFDPSVSVRYAALCACSMMCPQPYAFPEFLRHVLEAKLADPGKVDDDRVIAEAAARLLGRAS